MGIWQKLFDDSPEEPTAADQAPADDAGLLARSLDGLAGHGFHPSREVTLADLPADTGEGRLAFRRRPLTTLLLLPNAEGRPLFGRVHVDNDELNRVGVDDLVFFIEDAAEHAGTGDQLRDVLVMRDPGSARTGSLRYTLGHDVRDHSFYLDPDFGDEFVEAEILDGVSPTGYEAFTFYARPSMKPVTLWLDVTTDDSLVDALLAENSENPPE